MEAVRGAASGKAARAGERTIDTLQQRRDADSALWREDDAEQNALVAAYLPRGADVSTTIRRDLVVDLVIGNRHPLAVYFDFVVIANHATLGRATIH